MFRNLLKSALLLDLPSQRQRILAEHNMNTATSKERTSKGSSKGISEGLSPELFETLSKSMNADEPIKGLMTKTLNLMIEAEFEVKIGAQKSEQTPERKTVTRRHQTVPLRVSNQAI